MLGLYIFGTEFERHFGRQRFLEFYGICGVVGGLAYLALGAIKPDYATIPLVGASGAVYGLLIAAIIFFPHIQVVMIIFPMPIRVFGLIIAAILFVQLISPGHMDNPGGQLCHIAGAVTGLGMLYAWRVMPSIRFGSGSSVARRRSRAEGGWARKQRQIAEEREEVDRILEKVSHHGLQSLTWSEKRTLSRATQHQ
jgi:membrane associated rhomboid family serine protease